MRKDTRELLVRYADEMLQRNTFKLNDSRFFRFIYIFRYMFAVLGSDKKLSTNDNILSYARERLGDSHEIYKEIDEQFHFIPRFLYDTKTLYAIDYEKLLKASRSVIIMLVHDLPEKSLQKAEEEIRNHFQDILDGKKPYTYKIIERKYKDFDLDEVADSIRLFQQNLYELSRGFMSRHASEQQLRYIYYSIGISESIVDYTMERLHRKQGFSDGSMQLPTDFIRKAKLKNQNALKDSYKRFSAQGMKHDEIIHTFIMMGWSEQFVHSVLGD